MKYTITVFFETMPTKRFSFRSKTAMFTAVQMLTRHNREFALIAEVSQ